jgi:hypothetical protein
VVSGTLALLSGVETGHKLARRPSRFVGLPVHLVNVDRMNRKANKPAWLPSPSKGNPSTPLVMPSPRSAAAPAADVRLQAISQSRLFAANYMSTCHMLACQGLTCMAF